MNILVTGASKGIGKAIVKNLSEKGPCKIIIVARDIKKLQNIQEYYLSVEDIEIIPYSFDLSDSSKISPELLPKIEKEFDTLDILINNAGYLNNSPLIDMDQQDIKLHYEINLFSVIELIKSIVNLMKSSDIKHIVNIGTMGAVQGRKKYPGLSAYTSSKAALASLTELLYEELQPFGIKINYLALGAVETEMFNEAFPGSKAPLKPDDIASYIVNFALNNWRYINGKIIEVGL